MKVSKNKSIFFFILIGLTFFLFVFQNCSKVQFDQKELIFDQNGISVTNQLNSTHQSCELDGEIIEHDHTVIRYQSSSVNFASECQWEERKCTDGILNGNYSYKTCTKDAPQDCLWEGSVLHHDETKDAFSVASVPVGQTCDSVKVSQRCNNGELTNASWSRTCSTTSGVTNSDCSLNGVVVTHNTSKWFYLSSRVSSGQSCSGQDRQCTNGILDGNSTYSYGTCEADQPPNAPPPPSCGGDSSALYPSITDASFKNMAKCLNSFEYGEVTQTATTLDWQCKGSATGAQPFNCSVKWGVNGLCGYGTNDYHGVSYTKPEWTYDTRENFCHYRETSITVNGNGPWTWECPSTGAGHSQTCTIRKIEDGQCGSVVNESSYSTLPTSGFCGGVNTIPYNVPEFKYTDANGKWWSSGLWEWTCSGQNGGRLVTCMIQKSP